MHSVSERTRKQETASERFDYDKCERSHRQRKMMIIYGTYTRTPKIDEKKEQKIYLLNFKPIKRDFLFILR